MMPNMSSVLLNWSSAVQLKVVQQVPEDFESKDSALDVLRIEMVLQAMSPRKVQRKPEGERDWKWWEGWTTVPVETDTVLQDPSGKQFRVGSVYDWSQAGYYQCELVEQPNGLGNDTGG